MSSAISFERVFKHYRGAVAYRSLHESARALLGPQARRPRGVVRALDDVSFEIPEGESIALMGANGAGKTTALKLATRIAYPTAGTVRVRGRVGALIEVGTGMHPELTGRENVSLYGRILGLSKRDVAARFDEIVEFAGIGAAIDQPVKQYSSGMTLRLGFSVASHLEPDVLIVDEAIAVGDVGFQYRCLERMSQLVQEGRTLVFVSHNTSAIESLCERALLLRDGKVVLDGAAPEVISAYVESFWEDGASAGTGPEHDWHLLQIVETTLHDDDGRRVDELSAGEPFTIRLHYQATEEVRRPHVHIGLVDPRIGVFASASMLRDGGAPETLSGIGTIDLTFADAPILPRIYEVWGGVRAEGGLAPLVPWQRLCRFPVVDSTRRAGQHGVSSSYTTGPVVLPYSWSFSNGTGNGHGS